MKLERGLPKEYIDEVAMDLLEIFFNAMREDKKDVEDILGKKTSEFTQEIIDAYYNSTSKWSILGNLLMRSLFVAAFGCLLFFNYVGNNMMSLVVTITFVLFNILGVYFYRNKTKFIIVVFQLFWIIFIEKIVQYLNENITLCTNLSNIYFDYNIVLIVAIAIIIIYEIEKIFSKRRYR